MRTRIFRDSQTTGYVPSVWLPSNNLGTTNRSDAFTHTRGKSTMMDVVNENFRKCRNKGLIFNNPMYSEDVSYRLDPTTYSHDGRKGSVTIHHEYYNLSCFQIGISQPTLPDTNAFVTLMEEFNSERDLAITRSWANVDVSEMQILASLGELPETIGWMRSLLERGLKANNTLRKKVERFSIGLALVRKAMSHDPRDIVKINRWFAHVGRTGKKDGDLIAVVSNAWLEYRYAIRPLIFEMMSCIKAMQALIEKGSRQTARGKEITLYNGTSRSTHHFIWASNTETHVIETTEKGSVVARAGVLFQIEQDLDTLLSVWGFDQPLESIWELVPFSFIIDWFFSIGDVISSWSQSSGLLPLASWVTLVHKTFVTKKSISVEIGNAGSYVWNPPTIVHGSSYGQVYRKWRKPDPSRPVLPSFDLKLDLKKILDLGAIGRSITGSGSVPSYLRR